jgi:cytoskeletal protein CcmA (bactofilin family)
MTDLTDDLGIPIRSVRPSAPPIMPPRVPDTSRTNSDAPSAPAAPAAEAISSTNSRPDQVERRTLIVGREISLSGDITSCDRLVVEGTVEVSLHDCRELDIAATGLFKGNASIENAEVSGRFEGDLVVRKLLRIRASGHVSGSVTYGEIEIERGGKISGSLEVREAKSAMPF